MSSVDTIINYLNSCINMDVKPDLNRESMILLVAEYQRLNMVIKSLVKEIDSNPPLTGRVKSRLSDFQDTDIVGY